MEAIITSPQDEFLAEVARCISTLPLDIIQGWIENPEALSATLTNALYPPQVDAALQTWMTINLGTGPKTAEEFAVIFGLAGYGLSFRSRTILDLSAAFASETVRSADLVVVTPATLGLRGIVWLEEIYEQAANQCLRLCPPEVGAQLRLQYDGQPINEPLRIAMEPVEVGDREGAHVLMVERTMGGGLGLNTIPATGLHAQHSSNSKWVFILPS